MSRRLYVALEGLLLAISGDGDRWEIESQRDGWTPMCLAVHGASAEHVLCGTFEEGLWLSEDGARTWERADLDHHRVTAVAFDPCESQRAWAGTELTAVYRSVDGGRRWEEQRALQELPSKPDWFYPPRPEIHYVRWIAPDPNQPGRVFVSIEMGALVMSDDGGETWHDRVPGGPLDIHTLVMHRDAPGRLYATTGDGFVRAGYGFWTSDDAGATWSCPTDGMAHHYLWGLAVDPGDPDAMVISGANCPTALHSPMLGESFIYRRSDGGWVLCADGLPDPRGTIEPLLAANPAEPDTFYALTNKGIFRSTDQGASWRTLGVPWDQELAMRTPRALAVAG